MRAVGGAAAPGAGAAGRAIRRPVPRPGRWDRSSCGPRSRTTRPRPRSAATTTASETSVTAFWCLADVTAGEIALRARLPPLPARNEARYRFACHQPAAAGRGASRSRRAASAPGTVRARGSRARSPSGGSARRRRTRRAPSRTCRPAARRPAPAGARRSSTPGGSGSASRSRPRGSAAAPRTASTYVIGLRSANSSGAVSGEPPNSARSSAWRIGASSSYAAT